MNSKALVLPNSIPKACGLCLLGGLITGWAYFLVVGSSTMGSSPIGTMWVLVYSVAVGLFACMAFAWAVIAFVNRGNRKICFFSLAIALMLVLVVLFFFAAELSS
jgi:hypothetical protein